MKLLDLKKTTLKKIRQQDNQEIVLVVVDLASYFIPALRIDKAVNIFHMIPNEKCYILFETF